MLLSSDWSNRDVWSECGSQSSSDATEQTQHHTTNTCWSIPFGECPFSMRMSMLVMNLSAFSLSEGRGHCTILTDIDNS